MFKSGEGIILKKCLTLLPGPPVACKINFYYKVGEKMKTKEEIIKILKERKQKADTTTTPTPVEQAQEQQQKRAKERHEYLLREYDV